MVTRATSKRMVPVSGLSLMKPRRAEERVHDRIPQCARPYLGGKNYVYEVPAGYASFKPYQVHRRVASPQRLR